MKTTLTFEFDEGDEYGVSTVVHAHGWRRVAEAMDDYLRNRIKYEALTSPVEDALQAARDYLNGLCDEDGVTIHE